MELKALVRSGTGIALFLICALSFVLMIRASYGESAIFDESAHIGAGYSYVKYLDYRLNPEHPPLLKALSAFPLLFLNLGFPENDPAWTKDVNGQWIVGEKLFYDSGNDANTVVHTARLFPILLTILLIFLIYIWSAELLGRTWGLLPAFLFALSPNVLAHGHYVTTDIAAAFGVTFATFRFVRFLMSPSRRNLLFAGLAFGVAQVAKFSLALLVPYFLFLIFVFYLGGVARDWRETDSQARIKRFLVRGLRYLKSVIIIFIIGYALVVYPIYALFTWNYPAERQTSDTIANLTTYSNGPTPEGQTCKGMRCFAELDIEMTKHSLTRPLAQYLLGVLMIVQRSVGGNTTYFVGVVSAEGRPFYFPIVYALKESLPLLLMVLFALLGGIAQIVRRTREYRSKIGTYFVHYLGTYFAEFAMITFVFLYWIYSMSSNLNIGFRHLFPTLPFIYILTSSFWKRWVYSFSREKSASLGGLFLSWIKAGLKVYFKHVLLAAFLIWMVFETLLTAPYFLSYFNQLGGGTWNGYKYVTDSNYDWGQDLLRLEEFVKSNPEIQRIAVDYFGGGRPKYYLGDKGENWWSARGNPKDQSIEWLAVSLNTLQGATHEIDPRLNPKPEDSYSWLRELRPPQSKLEAPTPDFKAGTSIFIYKL